MYGKFTLLCSSLHIFLTVILLLLVRNIFQQIFTCFQLIYMSLGILYILLTEK